ncbi:endolytic transglycosylase MltG [Agrobacterium larrymoorei]|uniref:Endolytic murein transglycosylase n=1 Tax=Agrobacterium larrymoorei TaxID=160699 RepID=A0A4D7DPL7_9HYPH|nr:endolytic transglycosylase MltG [Agrobacterium larrymoorei]QCI98188.1 endolytic transglycosylase MltG [Agrobacterium larrymoorei]QYA06358.1 endolytic transglycosylase MltG [Agrobacterium larrymoorei]WHA40258.1 endolytic transglycosylase MltG [Agrobacterium larrymoorei]
MSDTRENNQVPYGRDGSGESKGGPIIPKSPTEALRPEKVPEPPKRSRKAHSQVVIFLNFLMTLVVAVSIVGIAGFYYMINTFHEPGPLQTNTTITVRNGAGLAEIANNLERSDAISNARIFRLMADRYLAAGQTPKPGEYEIKAHTSMKDILALLESGKSILYTVSFPEGLTVKQMFARLASDPVLEGDLPADLPPEGSLRPDTYPYTRGTKREEIVHQMRAAQGKLIEMLWERRDPNLPLKTMEEFVTLASIVEKETGKDDERGHVASVFYNRMKKNMRLQSDPTIIYGLFGGEGKPSDRPIYQSDLQKETPFNTYIIRGLPPHPIANPGRAALEATANPWRTDDLYFVADGTGGHAFAKTLDEHNSNVRRWRKIEAEKAASGGNTDTVVDGQPGGAQAEKPAN